MSKFMAKHPRPLAELGGYMRLLDHFYDHADVTEINTVYLNTHEELKYYIEKFNISQQMLSLSVRIFLNSKLCNFKNEILFPNSDIFNRFSLFQSHPTLRNEFLELIEYFSDAPLVVQKGLYTWMMVKYEFDHSFYNKGILQEKLDEVERNHPIFKNKLEEFNVFKNIKAYMVSFSCDPISFKCLNVCVKF